MVDTSDSFLPGLGHNHPPDSDWLDELHPAVLRDQWDLDYPELKRRRDELIEGYNRFAEKVTEIIDDATEAKATDFLGQFVKLERAAEETRKREKAPFDAAAAGAQRYFKADIIDPIALRGGKLRVLITAYKTSKDEKARRAREEEAKRAAEVAAKLETQAELTQRPEHVNDAAEAAASADRAMRKAMVPDPAAARSRGQGATSFLRTTYAYEVENIDMVPQEFTRRVVDDAKVTAALKAAEALAGGGPPALNIPGVRVVATHDTVVRS